MGIKIQLRRATTAEWTAINPILNDGEIGFDKDLNKIKIGNGVSNWITLPYSGGGDSGVGKSAYQSYLDTTTDNPKKTEAEWSNIKGQKGDPFTYQDFTPEQLLALKGADGKGWTENYSLEEDGSRILRKVISYIGGTGTVPAELTANVGKYYAKAGGFTTVKADATDFKGSGNSNEVEKTFLEKGYAISDPNGNIAFYIDENGFFNGNISRDLLSEIKLQLPKVVGGLPKNYNHIIGYGQSLAEGSNGGGVTPVVTDVPFSSNAKMFNHGIKTRYAVAPKYQSFVDHVETENSENRETPAAGLADRFITEMGIDGDTFILSSVPARGGQRIDQLSKGSEWYNMLLEDVRNGFRIAKSLGKTYRLICVTWTQGEADLLLDKEVYKTALIKLRQDIITDVQVITGENYSKLPFITYQVSTSFGTVGVTAPNIAIGQLELGMAENNGFYCATPIYHLEYADKFHLVAKSYKWYGNYLGLALSQLIKTNDFKPLTVISHTVSGNNIYLKLNRTGLAFEKPSFLTDTILNKGFNIKNGSTEIITAVTIDSTDTVKIVCSESPIGLDLTYGFQNANGKNAGELRDSNSKTVVIGGTTYNLYNWCTIFKRTI